jgi:hypothetical protein
MFLTPPLGRLSVVIISATAIAAGTVRAADTVGSPRVRSSHPYIRAMIAEAVERSPSFRRLVDAIDRTDGIVYVEQGKCGHSVRACLTLSVTPAGTFRILRVLVDSRQPDWDVMASIGHELQHAVEVLGERSLKTSEAVYLFYFREGGTSDHSFETAAAIKVGNAVRNEVVSFSRRNLQ